MFDFKSVFCRFTSLRTKPVAGMKTKNPNKLNPLSPFLPQNPFNLAPRYTQKFPPIRSPGTPCKEEFAALMECYAEHEFSDTHCAQALSIVSRCMQESVFFSTYSTHVLVSNEKESFFPQLLFIQSCKAPKINLPIDNAFSDLDLLLILNRNL